MLIGTKHISICHLICYCFTDMRWQRADYANDVMTSAGNTVVHAYIIH